jgi:hypothetical protein
MRQFGTLRWIISQYPYSTKSFEEDNCLASDIAVDSETLPDKRVNTLHLGPLMRYSSLNFKLWFFKIEYLNNSPPFVFWATLCFSSC